MTRVRLTRNARDDLLGILDYLAEESPRVAARTVDRLQAACAELGERAMMYPLVPRHEETGVRRRLVGNYGVYYVLREGDVVVLQVLHAARDHERILFPET